MRKEILEEIWRRFVGDVRASLVLRRIELELTESELSRLSPAQKKTWEALTHSGRRSQWSEARRAEWQLESVGAGAYSLSHSGEWLIAVGLARESAAGVGVDLEPLDRRINAQLRGRLLSSIERGIYSGSSLGAWVIKEACFKADPENKGRILPDYQITAFDSESKTGSVVAPNGDTLRFLSFEEEGYLLAFAMIS